MSGDVIVILGTGGTIAGTAVDPNDNVGYTAGQLSVATLVGAVPALAGVPLECEQVAQVDSKDMSFAVWQALARRAAHHLARDEVRGLVVTHGTDTLEETAYFLQRVLAPSKPVVITAAMRPATALLADGPQNLLDAVTVSREPGARGVVVAAAGWVFDAVGVRKRHSYRIDAFSAGDAGPIAAIEEGRLRRFRAWPEGVALGLERIDLEPSAWPRVEIVLNHVNADGRIVEALCAQGVNGLVVAGTGNGTLSQGLAAALDRAESAGVQVHRTTRCDTGPVIGGAHASGLSPVQSRVELILSLLVG